jgi:hypothetical protein
VTINNLQTFRRDIRVCGHRLDITDGVKHELVHTLPDLYDAVLQPGTDLLLRLFKQRLARDPDDHCDRYQGHQQPDLRGSKTGPESGLRLVLSKLSPSKVPE